MGKQKLDIYANLTNLSLPWLDYVCNAKEMILCKYPNTQLDCYDHRIMIIVQSANLTKL